MLWQCDLVSGRCDVVRALPGVGVGRARGMVGRVPGVWRGGRRDVSKARAKKAWRIQAVRTISKRANIFSMISLSNALRSSLRFVMNEPATAVCSVPAVCV